MDLMKLQKTENQDLKRQILVQNHSVWGGKLSVEEYLRREEILQSTAFGTKSLTTYVLLNENQDVLSSCEVYRRPAYYGRDGYCFAIGSVFTSPAYRKNGYASEMLKRLAVILEAEPDSLGSSLYSDIGPNFYAKLGWKLYPSVSMVYDLSYAHNPTASNIELLNLQDLPPLLASFSKTCKAYARSNEFYTIPCMESIEWLYTRSQFYASGEKVDKVGARSGPDFIAWFHDFKEEKLVITLKSIKDMSNTLALLDAAVLEAKRWGNLKKVEVWDPSPELINLAKDWKVFDRTDSLSSLMVFPKNEEVLWINNDKFAWV